MPLRVGTSSGIYMAARDVELHSTIRKLGYTLTRGVASMEIAVDVAHEVTYTEGKEIRYIARKQGVTLNMHGDLAVPICIPERGEWRDAHDRIIKSLRSAVFLGAKYVDFHTCLNIWLELMTYAGRKLTAAYVDGDGNFFSKIFKEDPKTREWFVRERGDEYQHEIFNRDELSKLSAHISIEMSRQYNETMNAELKKLGLPQEQVDVIITTGIPRGETPEQTQEIRSVLKEIDRDQREQRAGREREIVRVAISDKLASGEPWHREELRSGIGLLDGYHVMAHHMFFTQDPLWVAMAAEYKDVLAKYGYDTSDPDWLDKAWRSAETNNDREYKEFFYAAVGAKYLEGHLRKAFEWLYNDFIKKEIPTLTKDPKERKELTENASNLIIGLENPDAREPSHAGLYYLFRPKQIYAAVKTIRGVLKTDRVMMLMDHEHLATQGIDSLLESRAQILTKPDFGKLTIACHSNHPNPLHAHYPIELGDVILYELLYNLRVTGFGGGEQVGFLVFERGGGQDPFVRSIDALRLMAQFLEKKPPVPVDTLPLEFFGMKGLTGGDIVRQIQIVRDKAFEPMKDLLEIPEEEWTMLSQTAIKKGKRPEVWKKGEFR